MSDPQLTDRQTARLDDRGLLRIAGSDAPKFLQGVLTNDLGRVDGKNAIHAGLLSPQGKILFDVFVVRHPGEEGLFLMEAPKEHLAELAKRLSFYRLRAKVDISEVPDYRVAAAWGGAPAIPDGAVSFTDPRLPALGLRIYLPEGVSARDLRCVETNEDRYHAHRIALGVPEGGRDYPLGDTFPHEALFDQLNGIDFQKGCFVGQEVVSRMEHRGTARKRVVAVEGLRPLQQGAEVFADEMPIGTIGSVDGNHGLALLRLDRAKDALSKGTELRSGEVSVTLRRPDFASFDVPMSS